MPPDCVINMCKPASDIDLMGKDFNCENKGYFPSSIKIVRQKSQSVQRRLQKHKPTGIWEVLSEGISYYDTVENFFEFYCEWLYFMSTVDYTDIGTVNNFFFFYGTSHRR